MGKNLIFKCMLLLCALLTSATMSAQGNKITLEVADTELPSALRQVERQSGYYKFGYDADKLRAYRVTASIKNQTCKEAVETLVAGLPVSVSVEGKYIRLAVTADSKAAKGQTAGGGKITGTVVDEADEPLPGVSVHGANGKVIAHTDYDGQFTVQATAPKVRLRFTYIGMNPVETTVRTGQPVKVVMISNAKDLGEVVVTGYQVLDKRASTSAITSIKAEDILRADALSIDQMLEGQVPDLMYISNSGEAGAAPKIRIRGTSSIIGNREPLWVVDGIVVNDPVAISAEDLNDPDYVNRIGNAIAGLNPQDIERLDVLKDASATALYGTKAANGVIVITTKRGQEGSPRIRYNNSFTWKRRPRYSDKSVDVMNSAERIQLSRELWNQHYDYSSSGMNLVGFEGAMRRYYNGEISKAQLDQEIALYETVNTDWFDLLTHDSFSQSHTVSISGGGQKATYYGSLGFTDNDDVINNTTNRRYNAMVNLDINFAKWFTASFGVQGNVNSRENTLVNPVQYAYKSTRALPAFDPRDPSQYYFYDKYGRFTYQGHRYNILNELDNSSSNQNGNSATFNMNLRFKFADWMSANAIFSYTKSNTRMENYWSEKSWRGAELRDGEYNEVPGEESLMPQGGELSFSQTDQESWTARLQLDMNKYFCDELHNVAGSVGVEANSLRYKGYDRTDRGYFPDRGMSFATQINLDDYPSYKSWLAGNAPTLTDNKSNTLSAYVSLSYNYDRMVFLNVNARVDGSNNFGDRSNDKLLPIWSVSGSFDASRIEAIREITWLDQFTVKGSFGYQGNMLSSQSPVMIIRKGAFNNIYGEYTSSVERNPNPELKWEKTTSYNLGLELSFLNRRVQLEGDMYWKRTRDAFMSKQVHSINGVSSYIVNGGDIDNYGYSAAVTVRPIQLNDWQWSI